MITIQKPLAFLLSLTFLFLFSGSVYGDEKETIISKNDADSIFSLTMDEWNANSTKMFNPLGWTTKVIPLETGNGIASFDEKTQMSLMVQPLFPNRTNPPMMLLVHTFYPAGVLPEFTDEIKKSIEEAAEKDLGSGYSITFSYKG
ncbi:MAG: hypothetical protein QF443_05280, partial [Dehalococcoidia bacterium]|nr:hypothetical protein [Dehalococcoidia bacterium]